MTKEERRRIDARRKRVRTRVIKGGVVSVFAIVVPTLIYLAMQV